MDIKVLFGAKVKTYRQKLGLSQEALAHLADIDRTYISSIEKGERNVSIEIIEKLALSLKVSPKDFFE